MKTLCLRLLRFNHVNSKTVTSLQKGQRKKPIGLHQKSSFLWYVVHPTLNSCVRWGSEPTSTAQLQGRGQFPKPRERVHFVLVRDQKGFFCSTRDSCEILFWKLWWSLSKLRECKIGEDVWQPNFSKTGQRNCPVLLLLGELECHLNEWNNPLLTFFLRNSLNHRLVSLF